jgi:hypothetical protein
MPLVVSNTGASFCSPSSVVSGRLHSSRSTRACSSPTFSPDFLSSTARVTSIGAISPEKKPSCCARATRCWLIKEYSSCASRVTL